MDENQQYINPAFVPAHEQTTISRNGAILVACFGSSDKSLKKNRFFGL